MDIFDEILGGISLKIVNGQYVSHTENWRETKTKLYNTVWCVRRGRIHISIGGTEYLAKEGDVILFSPGDIYTAWTDEGCEFVFIFFNLEIGCSGNIPTRDGVSGILSGERVAGASRKFCSEYIKNTKNTKHPGISAYAAFFSFMTNMLSAVRDGECILFQRRDKGAASTDMQGAIEYMSEHFADGVSVKEVAAKFGISEKHFITRFRLITGMPPKKYLIECRMRFAVELLRERQRTMAEIAQELGYSDQYSFSKAFKKHYGEPPSFFR